MTDRASRAEHAAYAHRLRETLPSVRDQVHRAAMSVGRDPGEVRIVAVTKGHPAEAVRAALDTGLVDVGENRVEELEAKVAEVGREGVRWHMVGHVQRRKASMAVELADLIHSVDSHRLAERISRVSEGRTVPVLVQLNTSGEGTKGGFDARDSLEEAVEAVLRVADLPGLVVRGLMTMAPLTEEESVLRSAFSRLREVRDRARASGAGVGGELSMGMTNDLEVAVQEGSTMIRIGTALFGERP